MASVTLRIWARRSATEGVLAAELSGWAKTCCTAAFTVSVGLAAVAGLAAASNTAMMICTIASSLPYRDFGLVMSRAKAFQSLTDSSTPRRVENSVSKTGDAGAEWPP